MGRPVPAHYTVFSGRRLLRQVGAVPGEVDPLPRPAVVPHELLGDASAQAVVQILPAGPVGCDHLAQLVLVVPRVFPDAAAAGERTSDASGHPSLGVVLVRRPAGSPHPSDPSPRSPTADRASPCAADNGQSPWLTSPAGS